MSVNTVPAEIDDNVRQFCADVYPDSTPVYVPVRPAVNIYGAGMCTHIVPAHIKEHGGTAVTGWIIWYLKDTQIEAEFHLNWLSPDGELVDLTPKEDGETRIVFLPQAIEYDLSRPIHNRRRALVDTPSTRASIMHGVMFGKLRRKYWTTNGPLVPTSEASKVDQAAEHILRQDVPPDYYCVCESGKLFGKCCGRSPGAPFEFM